MEMSLLTCYQCGQQFERLTKYVNQNKSNHVFCSPRCQCLYQSPNSIRKPTINTMSDTAASWLAALIDSEGCIIFPREAQGNNRHEHVRIQIQMNSYDMLLAAQSIIGKGSIRKTKKREEHHGDSWMWSICGPNAAAVLLRIYPWMVIKREGALKGISKHLPEELVKETAATPSWSG